MPTVQVNPPFQFTDVQGTLGHSYLFAQEEILLELQDRLNVLGLGVVSLRGDVMGSGTDTLRITDYGNVGYSLPFTALASETDTVAPSPIDIGFETVTVGEFGLSQSETYKEQVLNREPAISLDRLKAMVPQSWMRTFRDQITTTGSGITTAVGSAATTLSVDDHLDLLTAYRTTLGSRIPTAFLDPTPMDQLVRSYRNEPAFQNNTDAFARLFALATGQPGDVRSMDVTQHRLRRPVRRRLSGLQFLPRRHRLGGWQHPPHSSRKPGQCRIRAGVRSLHRRAYRGCGSDRSPIPRDHVLRNCARFRTDPRTASVDLHYVIGFAGIPVQE